MTYIKERLFTGSILTGLLLFINHMMDSFKIRTNNFVDIIFLALTYLIIFMTVGFTADIARFLFRRWFLYKKN
jgi:hypothetical protein